MADDDSFEVWGTFSVRDHLQPWAFVAEVLIYDRLVVPVPPEGDDDEERRWVTERWDPARQRDLLEVLGELAVQVEWDADRRRQWGAEFAAARERLGNQVALETGLAYQLTGARLIDDVPRLARPVVATTPFTSIPEIERTLEIARLPAGTPLPPGTISAVMGTEFLIPADPRRGEIELLEDAVAVARSQDYRVARAALHAFQRKFIREGATDAESVKAAVDELHKRAIAVRTATDRENRWGGVRRVLEFSQVTVPLGVGLVTQDPVAAGQAAIGLGAYTVTNRLRDPSQPGSKAPEAALVVDAGRRLADF